MVEKMILKQMQATTGIEKFVMCSTTVKKKYPSLDNKKNRKKMWPFLEYNLFDVTTLSEFGVSRGWGEEKGFCWFFIQKRVDKIRQEVVIVAGS